MDWTGFKPEAVPAIALYEANGLEGPPTEEPSDKPKRIGASPLRKLYRPGCINPPLHNPT